MRKILFIILWIAGIGSLYSANSIEIPLIEIGLYADSPKGSTPDPSDPNQIRAALTGNTLRIEKNADGDTYEIVIQERLKEGMNEAYYNLTTGAIVHPITRVGQYIICISSLKGEYIGCLQVNAIYVCGSNGQRLDCFPDAAGGVLNGFSVVTLETSLGTTTSKFFRLP